MFSDDWKFIYSLNKEYQYYKHYNYGTAGLEIVVRYYDKEEDDREGYIIMQTPFDWTGYDVIPPKQDILTEDLTLLELLRKGEGNQVEFKSSLVYHFGKQQAAIGVKAIIARTICAFLNSNGGYLCIGIKKEKEGFILQGLDYDFSLAGDKDPEDFFELEFDEMLSQFFSLSVKSLINASFEVIDDKVFYKVKVSPSLEPVFLKGQFEKEFYVRGMRSTHKLNVEEFCQYYKSHWKK
jgi:hypothetical protein